MTTTRETRYDLLTLGESMLRLSPPGNMRLEQATQLDLFPAGAESNLAIALARLGKRAAWMSRLPDSPLGYLLANNLRQHGVDVSGIVWAAGERVGTYFVEFAAPPRSSRIWYDRAGSAASRMTPADLPLDKIAAARWLHLTGITPALSPSCAETVRAAMTHARDHGLTISFDVNYRALLWPPDVAGQALAPFCEQADYTLVAVRDAHSLFGATEDAETAARELQARFGGCVIITRGAEGSVACDGQTLVSGPGFETTIVDRVGAGDAFDAGVICRLLEGADLADALRFGAAVAALKMTIPGDVALISRAEVEDVLRGGKATLQR